MVIEDLGAGKRLAVKISRDDETADFETIIIDRIDTCLVVEPITYEGQKVSFTAENLKKIIQAVDDNVGKLFEWRDVEIKAGVYKKTTQCHLIYVKSDPIEINRRGYYRQYIGITGMMMPLAGENMNVDVKDVSNMGVGFVCDSKGQLEVGGFCVIVFTDEEYKFELNCTIVRERQLPNGRYEFGCRINKAPSKLPMYIAHKQVETRRKALTYR